MFSRLGDVGGARVLDLYAGTGALSIEALSRGAEHAVLVERERRALDLIRENLQDLDLSDRSRVLRGEATVWLGRLGRAGDRFDLIFVDPPYASDEVARALVAVVESKVLATGGVLVVETAKRHPPAALEGLRSVETWDYGDTIVTRMER